MSLQGAMSTAVTGLRSAQVGIDLVARNVANADTAGYTAKSQNPVAQYTSGQIVGVSPGRIEREVDAFLQQQLRTEIGIGSAIDIRADILSRIDQLLGTPGEANALDTVFNEFGTSLQSLISSPEQFISRAEVMQHAAALAETLNRLTTEVQEMRQQTELSLGDAVDQANVALQEIARLNQEIQGIYDTAPGVADLMDERDRYIDQLSQLMDVKTAPGERGAVRVYTGGGNLLVDTQAVDLVFDMRTGIDATAQYSLDEAERGVGTIYMTSLGGTPLDLFRHGDIRSGSIAAYRELRDDTLVQVQAQLDELAHGLALAFSGKVNEGTATSVGAQNGFDLDVAGLMAGNEISVTYTQTPPGSPKTYTFVRVDQPGSLPLANTATNNPNDIVVGIDFSTGFASAVSQIDYALGTSVSVTSPSADTIRILDDGAAGTISIDSVSAFVTPSALQDQGIQLDLFQDLDGTYQTYSNSRDGYGQKTGFAGRIALNSQIVADNSLLVLYQTSPATGQGDPARPQELFERFSQRPMQFSAASGIGTETNPFNGSLIDFTQRVINLNGQNAEVAKREQEAQTVVIDTLRTRFDADTKVNVDEEMSQLLVLQNAYAANARVMSVVKELLDILMRV